jgi:hypothetical protein
LLENLDKRSQLASTGMFRGAKKTSLVLPQPSENDAIANRTQSSVATVYSYIRVP